MNERKQIPEQTGKYWKFLEDWDNKSEHKSWEETSLTYFNSGTAKRNLDADHCYHNKDQLQTESDPRRRIAIPQKLNSNDLSLRTTDRTPILQTQTPQKHRHHLMRSLSSGSQRGEGKRSTINGIAVVGSMCRNRCYRLYECFGQLGRKTKMTTTQI